MSIIYTSSQWINSVQQEQLLEMFFERAPIIIDWNFHGSQKVVDNQLIFGAWAGPHQCLKVVLHEMAHLVEIDDARILSNGWGLNTPQTYIPGRYSRWASVPVSYQPSLRECRTIALQWNLQNFLLMEETPRDAISSLRFMPDWFNIPQPDDYKDISELDELRMQFIENKMLEYTRGKYTLQYFISEWNRKIELLKAIKK